MKTKGLYWAWTLLGLLLCLGCAARTTEAWSEPFEAAGSWQLSSDSVADVSLQDERLVIHIFEPEQVAWAAAGRTLGDQFYLRVEATQESGPEDNEYGVLVRMDGDRRFYAFSISGDGYVRAAHYAQGRWSILGRDWTPEPAIHQGAATNVLELECRGTHYRFLVNGVPVLEVEDSALSRGDVGLYAGAFGEGGVVIAFDNLELGPLQD